MKLLKRVFVLALLIALLLTGCSRELTSGIMLRICGSYAVPGMFSYDLKGDAVVCSVIDTDSFGRILFSYTGRSVITGQKESVFVICQGYDADYVYFYEDECYLFNKADVLDDESIVRLKSQNDWNREINQDKLTRRTAEATMDLVIKLDSLESKKLRSVCCSKLSIVESEIKELCVLDVNSNGQSLYYLEVISNNVVQKYFVAADAAYEISCMPIENNSFSPEELATFKDRFGWIY